MDKVRTSIRATLADNIKIIGVMLRKILSKSFALFNLISLILITPIVTFYMLRDWDRFVSKVNSLLPRKSKKSIRKQAKEIDRALAGFIRGQLSVCLLLGCYYGIGLHLINLDLGIVIGFFAGLLSFIPYVGSITGFILSILMALAQFNDLLPVVLVVFVFVSGQFIEGNFLTPMLVGENVGLHPVWIMFALLAGGVLLGFLGLLIAVPTAAVIGVLIRHAIDNYKHSSLYLED
jgi:predicted PurR-regulated permease PerM